MKPLQSTQPKSESSKSRRSEISQIPRLIFTQAIGFHNGVFATLEEVVTFYNDRDALGFDPEVGMNVNDAELRNLGLTPDQERKLVLFMKTLSDD